MNKKLKNILNFFSAFVLLQILIISLFVDNVEAGNYKSTVSVKYKLENTEFKLYKIAEKSKEGKYNLVNEFINYRVDLSNYSSMDKAAVANTLESYIKRDGLKELRKGVTDSFNSVNFTALDSGLYLIMGETKLNKDYRYYPTPVLLEVTENSNREIVMDLKYEKNKIDKKIKLIVYKIWDDGDSIDRPNSIDVQLLRNGQVLEEEKLSKYNNWCIEWKNLSPDFTYDVIEKDVPKNYYVTVNRDGEVIKICNTLSNIEGEYLTREENEKEEEPFKIMEEKVPQTGQLWYPVIILLILASVFFIIGKMSDKKNENK